MVVRWIPTTVGDRAQRPDCPGWGAVSGCFFAGSGCGVVGVPVVATNALLALLLVLFMPFPGELFNRTLDEHYDEVTGWLRRVAPGGR